jgi:hypothetical protein
VLAAIDAHQLVRQTGQAGGGEIRFSEVKCRGWVIEHGVYAHLVAAKRREMVVG